MRSRNQRSWLMTTTQPGKPRTASSRARKVSPSRSLVGSRGGARSRRSSAPLASCTRFARHQRAGPPSSAGAALETKLATWPWRAVHGPDHDRSSPPAISSNTVVSGELVAGLVDVAEDNGRANVESPCVGRIISDDHPKQRGLACAVRPDHPDDPSPRQEEREIAMRGGHRIPWSRPPLRPPVPSGGRRDGDLELVRPPLAAPLGDEVVVGIERALPCSGVPVATSGSTRARLETAWRDRSPSPRPPGVPAFARSTRSSCPPRDARPRSSSRINQHVVQEVAVVGDGRRRCRVVLQRPFEQATGRGVRWLGGLARSSSGVGDREPPAHPAALAT